MSVPLVRETGVTWAPAGGAGSQRPGSWQWEEGIPPSETAAAKPSPGATVNPF